MTDFKPNLASAPKTPITFPKWGSPKLDGIRCVVREGVSYTRSLKQIPNLHIRQVLTAYTDFDGELIVGDPTSEGCYNRTDSGVMTIKEEPQFTYYVFDKPAVPAEFTTRYTILCNHTEDTIVKILPQTLIESQVQLDNFYENLLLQGYEGAILRNPTAMYKHGRSTALSQDMLKLKPYEDSEAIVLGVYEAMYNGNEAFTNELGRTARSKAMGGLEGKGMIGGFHVRDIVSGIEFDCAPGKSTHLQRIEWWLKPPINKILKYRHMPYGVKDRPRSGRYIGWRNPLDM